MRHVWPVGGPGRELDREALAVAYAYPTPPAGLREPFVRLNFVASADGAVSVGGVSGGLDAPGDSTVFGVLREVADVVVAGAATVRAEGYRGARTSPGLRARRRARGQAEVPPIAVVTASCDLDPSSALFTDTTVPPLVLTGATAAAADRERLEAAGAEVVVVGDGSVAAAEMPDGRGGPAGPDVAGVLAALAERGLTRVLCEGGPTLAGTFAAADRVDELCLSLAPQLAGPGAGRIVEGPGFPEAHPLRLAAVLAHEDGVMLRYRTPRGDAAAAD